MVLFDRCNNTGDGKMDGSFLEEKSCFKMLDLPLSGVAHLNCILVLKLSLLLTLPPRKL